MKRENYFNHPCMGGKKSQQEIYIGAPLGELSRPCVVTEGFYKKSDKTLLPQSACAASSPGGGAHA